MVHGIGGREVGSSLKPTVYINSYLNKACQILRFIRLETTRRKRKQRVIMESKLYISGHL